MNKNYKIADLKGKGCENFRQIEEQLKMEFGKDIVLIAYEKEDK